MWSSEEILEGLEPESNSNTLNKKSQPGRNRRLNNILEDHGLSWDAHNYSCAYDSIITSLNVLSSLNPSCHQKMGQSQAPVLQRLCNSFNDVHQNLTTLLNVHENFKNWISATYANRVPRFGGVGTDQDEVLTVILTYTISIYSKQKTCPFCRHQLSSIDHYTAQFYANLETPASISAWIAYIQNHQSHTSCPSCLAASVQSMISFHLPPALILFNFANRNEIDISKQFDISINDHHYSYSLKTIIYFGSFHFTSRSFDGDSIGYHDRIATDVNLIGEHLSERAINIREARDNRQAISAIYALT